MDNMDNIPQQQKPTVIDAVNVIFRGLEKAQQKGAFTIEDSSNLYIAMKLLKEHFEENKQKTSQ